VHSLILGSEKQKMESFRTRHKTWTGETFFLEMKFDEDAGYKRDMAFASDIEGKIYWSMKVKDSDDYLIASCMLKEAKILIERSEKIEGDKILIKQLHALRMHANSLKSDFLKFKTLILKSFKTPTIKRVWTCSPLQIALDIKKIRLYDFLRVIGVNPDARYVEVEQVYENLELKLLHYQTTASSSATVEIPKENTENAYIKLLTPIESAFEKFLHRNENNFFIWNLLKRGGMKFIKTEKDLDFILRTFIGKDKKFPGKLQTKYSGTLFLHAVKNFEKYANGDGEIFLEYFLTPGEKTRKNLKCCNIFSIGDCCSLATQDSDLQTVLHIAAQKISKLCLETLWVIIKFF